MRWLLILLLLPLASGYEEIEAPFVRVQQSGVADVLAVGHEPDMVQPGTQWMGYIQFADGHNITAVHYQICNVGQACFAPPTPATKVDANRYEFDTNDYTNAITGNPVRWEAGWRVGVQYILYSGENSTAFPESEDIDPELHYFAFDMPVAEQESPGLGFLAVLGLIALAVRIRK